MRTYVQEKIWSVLPGEGGVVAGGGGLGEELLRERHADGLRDHLDGIANVLFCAAVVQQFQAQGAYQRYMLIYRKVEEEKPKNNIVVFFDEF